MRPRITHLIFGLTILISLTVSAAAQTGKVGTITEKPRPRSEEPVQKTRAAVRVITKVVEKPVTPLTGRLFVVAEPGAVILIEPLNVRGADAQKGTVPDGQRALIFNDLKPGNYRVAATLGGYHPEERDSVLIKRNESQTVTLNFERILYSVTINTNVDAGELKYGKVGETPKSLDFQSKSVKLDLPAGDYEAEITASGFGYEAAKQRFTVKDNGIVELPLKRIVPTTETLAPTWTNAEVTGWEMPSTWRVDSKKLVVKGRGLALPKDARSRYYQDFRIDSNVNMTNGVAVSFALRARDSQNYYLVQLTGGNNSDETYVVRLLVVKGGEARRVQAIPISRSKAAAMASGQFFNLSLKMVGYEITVDIVDSQTGEPYHLGVLTDPDHNFAIGAVGIAARDNEENMIERFVVCTGKCLEG